MMKTLKRISAFFLAIMLIFTMNIAVFAEETTEDLYEVKLSPENYAGIFFNVTAKHHENSRAIEAYYNTRYPTNDYLYAEHFSMIASYNVPIKNALENITMSWWVGPSGMMSGRTIPVFYDLNKFSPDIEAGAYKGLSGAEEDGYKSIEEWAVSNYWPLDQYGVGSLPFSSQLAHSILETGSADTYTYDITDKVLASYTDDTCTSEYITLATGRETSGYANSYFRMYYDSDMPYITVKYKTSDILRYVNTATKENITKVISDIGAINVLSESTVAFSEYKALSDDFKQIVGEIILSNKTDAGFTSFAEISSAFDTAMNLDNIILSIINSSTEENIAENMVKIGDAGAFSESTTGYQAYLDMSDAAKAEVNKNMLLLIPEETGFLAVSDIATAFDSAMVLKTVSFEVSPKNYATLYITGTGYYTYSGSLDLHYNRLYSRSNDMNALHMSIISSFEIPFKEKLADIKANYYFTPGNNDSTSRKQPFFYDLNKFEIDAEAGIYDNTTTQYASALSYAKNYWSDEGVWNWNSSKFNTAYVFNHLNTTDEGKSGFKTRTLDIAPSVLSDLKKSQNDYLTLSTGRCNSQYMNYNFQLNTVAKIPTLTLTYYEADIVDIVNKATTEDIVDTLDNLANAGVFSKTQSGADLYLGLTPSGKKEIGVNLLNNRGEEGFESIEELQTAWDSSMTLEEITTQIVPNNYAVAHTLATYGSYGYGSYHDKYPGGTYTSRIGGELLKSYVNRWTMSDFSRKTYANLYSEKVLTEYKIPMKNALSGIYQNNALVSLTNDHTSGNDIHFAFDKFSFSTIPAAYQGTYTKTVDTGETDENGDAITTTEEVVSATDAQFKELNSFATSSIWQAGPQDVQTNFVSGYNAQFNQEIDLTSYVLSGFKASSSDYILTRVGGASAYDGWRMTKVPSLKLSYTASSVLDYINAQTDAGVLLDELGVSGLLNASASGYNAYKGIDESGKKVISDEILLDIQNGGYESYSNFIEAYDTALESYLNEAIFEPVVDIDFNEETVENTGTDTTVSPEFNGEAQYVTGLDGSKALYIENTFGKEAQNYLDLGEYKFGEDNFSIVFWMRAVNAGIGEFGHDKDGASSTSAVAVDFTNNSYTLGGVVLSNKDFSVNDNTGFAFTAMPASADFGVNMKVGENEAMNTVAIDEPVESRWHQIAYTVDRNGNAVTYVDDVEVASFNISSSTGSVDSINNAHLVFGADGLGQYGMISGEFDDIKIYPFAIGETKLEEMYYKKMLDKVNYEADTLLNTESMNSIYSAENKQALSEELNKSVAFSDDYIFGNMNTLIEKYNEFNGYYNDFLNKDSKGSALYTSDIHISGTSTSSDKGLWMVKSLNQHKDLGIDLKTWITAGDYAETGNNHQPYFFNILDNNIPEGVNAVVARGNHDEPADGERYDEEGNKYSLTRDELREEFQDRMDKYFDKDDKINEKLIGEDGTLNEPYYYLNDGIAHYIVIDNYDTTQTRWISPEQFVWLEETLDAISGDGKAIFIIQHLPIRGSVGGSTGGYYLYEEYGTQLVELLNSYENDNIFLLNGHTHNGFGGACNSVVDFGNFYQINTTSFGKGASRGYSGTGVAQYINVYDDRVIFRARDFVNDEWLRDYDLTFMLKEASSESFETKISVSENKVSIENKPEAYTLIVASYLGNKLVDVKCTYDIGEDNEVTFLELELITENTDSIKAMLWNSLEKMEPLCK